MLASFQVFGLLLLGQLVYSAQVFDILKYGAKGDGTHSNTKAIADAIAAASAASGGGTVHFPAGHYLTGQIHFKSNVVLDLAKDATIVFSDKPEDYAQLDKPVQAHSIQFTPLISAENVTHIGITGSGTLDGSGKKWWDLRHQWRDTHKNRSAHVNHLVHKVADLFDSHGHLVDDFSPPKFFTTMHAKFVTLRGVSFINSPFFTILPSLSEHVVIDHVSVRNPANAPNTDGIDPDSSRDVLISNCFVSTGDDCLAIKTRLEHGKPIPAENITITDCTMHSGHGGFVIGSTTIGGVKNVHVRNMHFEGTDRGIRIKTARGHGGVVEDIHISNITMKGITHEGITINAVYGDYPMEPKPELTPYVKDIFIEDVTGDSKLGIQIIGLAEKHFTNIQLKNVHMTAEHDTLIKEADHVIQTNVTVTVKKH